MRLVWATRGRSWGFRFLRTGGLADPYPIYEAMFEPLEGAAEGVVQGRERTALRFADPLGRADRAGRIISHDFVLFGDLAAKIGSIDDGLREVWPLVADEYVKVWDLPKPPVSPDL